MTQLDHNPLRATRVAIIGAGPAGLASARWLKARGAIPVILEAAADLGGQWNPQNPSSATWPGMHTNTSRIVTAFSDLDHAQDTPVFPAREAIHAYLRRYAEAFDLIGHIRFGTTVESLTQGENSHWHLQSRCGDVVTREDFAQVVIASGRHVVPDQPAILGLARFGGALGALHSARYPGPTGFRGARVVVAGCSISALEIASELAASGAAEVTVAMRRQRYVIPKIIAGVPADNVMFTRAATLAGEALPPAAQARGLKAAVLGAAGNPAQYGAHAPEEDIFAAGLTQSQGFLPAVAEGRIRTAPWIAGIEGESVAFTDGTSRAADALILGTGFRHNLAWLAPEVARTVNLGAPMLDLFAQTLHPDLAGLAFVGQVDLVGPTFPVMELQARLVAGVFSGQIALPSAAIQRRAMAGQRAAGLPPALPMHIAAIQLSRLIGCEPDPRHWPDQARALMFGPLTAASFRLEGADALPDAPARTAAAAEAFGRITDPVFAPDELALIEGLKAARANAA